MHARTFVSSVVFTLAVLLTTSLALPVDALSAKKGEPGQISPPQQPADKDKRTAFYSKFEDQGWTDIGNDKTVHEWSRDTIQITFPINGGPLSGFNLFEMHTWAENDNPDLALSGFMLDLDSTYSVTGEFDGGDGGALKARMTSEDGEDAGRLEGIIHADGRLVLRSIKKNGKSKTLTLTFPPFEATCNTDLNAYEKELAEEINKKLLDMASQALIESLLKTIQFGADKAYWSLANSTFLSASRKFELAYGRALVDDLTKGANHLVYDRLGVLTERLSLALGFMEAAYSASGGDYSDAAVLAVCELVASYSNVAGLMIAAAKAAKADWDAFAKRWHAGQFRKFYVDLYYDGGKRPTSLQGKMRSRALRLQAFMDLALEYLATMDNYRGRPFRNMLKDYAYYQLEMNLSNDDFAVKETAKGPRLKNKAVSSVLGALFRSYEQVYENDLKAEEYRKIAIKMNKHILQGAKKTKSAWSWAENGNFKEVWSAGEFEKIFCTVLAGAKKMFKASQE